MNWWYLLGDALGAFVLLPALVWSLIRLVRPLVTLRGHAASILASCGEIAAAVDELPRLGETQMLTGSGGPGVERITEALEQALDDGRVRGTELR